ncbi:MAG: hypothetical protein CBC13_11255 [Planctomycetia bacterium TMED53]|nr:MAG: hypothetical protein CBC13_11255 [Planctomycetia bacterium TMED53]
MKSDILLSPATPDSDSLSAGDTQPMQTPSFDKIGHFVIEEKMGEGGMGIVYRAHDPSLQRTVAIKRVHPRLKDHDDIREKFLAEARAIAAVNHPNIGQIHAIHDDGELPYLVMEFLPGPSFEELLQKQKCLETLEVLRVALAASRALEEARNQGIIHRDIKPSNLIIDSRDSIKLVDFGLAGPVGELTDDETEVVGTPQYCSPEQVQGSVTDERSDIYSLGATLFHLLTGSPPYRRDSRMDLLIAHVNAPVPRVTEVKPGLDPELDDLLHRMMAKDPKQRPQNYREVLQCLRGIESRLDPSKKQSARSSLIAATTVALLITVVGWAASINGGIGDWLGFPSANKRVSEYYGDLLAHQGAKDLLDFDFKNGELERFFRMDPLEDQRATRKRISLSIRDGQLRWANDSRTVSFPFMSEIDSWEIHGLRCLGNPDLELQVAGDPDQPGNRWRISLPVGRSAPPRIEVLQQGSPVAVEIEDLQRTGVVREGVNHHLKLEKLDRQNPDRQRYQFSISTAGEKQTSDILTIVFSIPVDAIPSGAPGLRFEGDISGWNSKVDRVLLQGALDRERVLRALRMADVS